jgi:folylpolyglutamate synthase/dihydropteroate synthase
LPEIATQKAGIIKASVPVVISQTQEETERVFTNKALEKNTSIFFADKVMEVIGKDSATIGLQKMKVVNTAKMSITNYELDILGKYQQKNVKGVLLALEILQQYKIIMWSWLSYDYDTKTSVNTILKKAQKIRSGDILVLHDNPKIALKQKELLPKLIQVLKLKKFTFETIIQNEKK